MCRLNTTFQTNLTKFGAYFMTCSTMVSKNVLGKKFPKNNTKFVEGGNYKAAGQNLIYFCNGSECSFYPI
jgi:hypothetical protein